jgi:hypothetical protein
MTRARASDARTRDGVASAPARRIAALIVVAAAALAPSCKTPEISFELDVPSAVAQNAAWYEIGVFPGASCPPAQELAGGIPQDGASADVAFAASSTSPPAIGTLAKGNYAFAAVARQSDCSVIGVGCLAADVSKTSDITIPLTPLSMPVGPCEPGTVCEDARCLPSNDNSNPSVGAGCSLELVGAGPLGDPLSIDGEPTLLTAPAIAPTTTGFLIAYREFDPSMLSARLTLLPIDTGGGSLPIQTLTLPEMCGAVTNPDATGLAFDGNTGLVALARTACEAEGGTPGSVGIDLYGVNPMGSVTTKAFAAVGQSTVSLARSHALTATPEGFLLAMTLDGSTAEAAVSGASLTQTPTPFGNAPPESAGWVAATDAGTALVALGTGIGTGVSEGGAPDDAGTGSTLRVNTAPPAANLAALPPATEFPASWGAVSMVGPRVIVASNGTTTNEPVAWTAFDVGNPTPVASGGFATNSLGMILYSDIVLNQDNAFFAVEAEGMTGTISLVAFDHVSTTPAFLREVDFSAVTRIPMMNVRDGLVAVTATDTRVAVVWGTGMTLGMNDPVGGYAVFACTP